MLFFFSSRRRHTRCALVTGVQTCALPICPLRDTRQPARQRDRARRIVDPPIVSVNVSRRRAHAEDAARREDRLDLETLDSGVAGVLEGGTDAALDLDLDALVEIGRAHVSPVTNAHLVCRLLLEKKKK